MNADEIITDELRSRIGRTTPLLSLELMSPSDVRRYVDATGDANPLWLDDEFAWSQGYRGRRLNKEIVLRRRQTAVRLPRPTSTDKARDQGSS